jgi:hypothetical protein
LVPYCTTERLFLGVADVDNDDDDDNDDNDVEDARYLRHFALQSPVHEKRFGISVYRNRLLQKPGPYRKLIPTTLSETGSTERSSINDSIHDHSVNQ